LIRSLHAYSWSIYLRNNKACDMKLKFKHQAYQANAVDAVADCFAGQSLTGGIQYRVDPGRVNKGGQQSLLDESGFRNGEISKSINLLENIHAVQRRQNLP